MRKAGSSG